jgi:hypothetical protein
VAHASACSGELRFAAAGLAATCDVRARHYPKNRKQVSCAGRIWVDAADYAIVRIEGKPAKNPSFWVKTVHFVHTYRKS